MTREPSGAGGRHGQPLLSNTSVLLASRLVIAVLGWAGTVVIVRELDSEAFGQFSLVFSILGMMSLVTDMGVGRIALHGVTTGEVDERAELAGTYVVLRSSLGVVGYVLALAIVVLLGYPEVVVRATAIGGLVVLLATPSAAFQLAFQAKLKLGRVAVATAVGQAAQLALTVAIAVAGGSLLLFMIPAVVAEVVILTLTYPAARRLLPFHYTVRPDLWKAMLKEALPLSIGGALATIYYRVDVLMLSRLDDFDAVAVYGVAYKFADLVRFVSSAISVPILALLVQSWPNDVDQFRSTLRRGAAFLGFFAGLSLVQFGLFADEAIELLYGTAYVEGADATRLLVGGQTLVFFTSLAYAALVAAGRHRAYPFVMLAGLVLNVALNVPAIRWYSYEGAAVATVVTELVVVALMFGLVQRTPGVGSLALTRPLAVLLVPVAAAATAGWAAVAVMPWVGASVLVALVYAGSTHVMRPFGPGGLRAIVTDAPD